jgi:hypothetical protein
VTALLLAGAVGVALGAGMGTAAAWWWMARRADLANYDRLRLEVTRVRDLYDTADHELRLRRRFEAAYHQTRATVAAQQRTIARLTRPRHLQRSAMPAYGVHR